MERSMFSVRWHPHQQYILKQVNIALMNKEFVDVTIFCAQQETYQNHTSGVGNEILETPAITNWSFDAHKLILAACSQFFSKLFHENAQFGPNSLIVLPKDIRPQDFAHLLQYMYQGQVEVPREDLDHVLKAAQILKIEGLIRSADEFSSANRRRKSKPKYRFMKSVNKKTVVNNVPPKNEREEHHHQPCNNTLPTRVQLYLMNKKPKTYTKEDMDQAIENLRDQKMSLTKASEIFKIPATTLWQRANKLGIPTPKKDSANKTWCDTDLHSALIALKKKEISVNKASKVYGIPSSTLYKIARKEKIELAQPFNALSTTWNQNDLNQALDDIKNGLAVQKAASKYGIPSGTLYGRCKKVGIELSKTVQNGNWCEDDMNNALESVKSGGLSINQVNGC